MKSITEKIEDAFTDRLKEGVLPDLLIINNNDERELFTECGVPKNTGAEEFIMDKYKAELFVTKLKTEPEFYGRYKYNQTSA